MHSHRYHMCMYTHAHTRVVLSLSPFFSRALYSSGCTHNWAPAQMSRLLCADRTAVRSSSCRAEWRNTLGNPSTAQRSGWYLPGLPAADDSSHLFKCWMSLMSASDLFHKAPLVFSKKPHFIFKSENVLFVIFLLVLT